MNRLGEKSRLQVKLGDDISPTFKDFQSIRWLPAMHLHSNTTPPRQKWISRHSVRTLPYVGQRFFDHNFFLGTQSRWHTFGGLLKDVETINQDSLRGNDLTSPHIWFSKYLQPISCSSVQILSFCFFLI